MLAAVLATITKLVIILKLGLRNISKKDNKSHIFKHLHSTTACFHLYNSVSFKAIGKANLKLDLEIKETLHIKWIKPHLNAQQNHLALTLSL